MLRILPLADGVILPQAKQESYFFNRIGRKQSVTCTYKYLGQFTLKSSMPTPSILCDAFMASLHRLTGLQRLLRVQCTDVETVTPGIARTLHTYKSLGHLLEAGIRIDAGAIFLTAS